MSIVALKRKTQAKYNNLSVGRPQFSLNGGHRSQGYVGQDNLGRYLSRTIYGGNVPKGHGGCCGTYAQSITANAGMINLENPNVIKTSVINTRGMLDTKYRWIRRPDPFSVVKPDTNNNITEQSSYIKNKSRKSLDCSVSDKTVPNPACGPCANLPGFNYSASRNVINTANIAGDPSQVKKLTQSQSEYIERVFHRKCQQNDIVYVASKTNGTPFACG
jgi:hypothetical protein